MRDNGHGIAPEDRHFLGQSHCTSKIESTDDLRDVGASFLGFRGEALASAAELSGSLVILTRVEGEATAIALHIAPHGGAFK